MIRPGLLEALRSVVGSDGLVQDQAQQRSYEVAARYGEGRAAVVIRPADADEVSRVLAVCAAHRLDVVPQSGNTGLVLGSTPDETAEQAVLSLDRMRRVIEVSRENRSITAEAGARLSDLNAALKPHGLWLPIDLGADPMVGGMVATNTGGARFIRYGDVRSHILGLDVARGDGGGSVLRLGDGVRKDNARLALKHLMVGSCGALGVITRATFLVHPRPLQTAAAIIIPKTPHDTLDILMHVETHAAEHLSAFEAMSGGAMDCALALPHVRSPFPDGAPDYALLLELSSAAPPDSISLDDALVRVLSPLMEGDPPLIDDAIIAPPADLWRFRHAIPEGLKACGQVIGFDLAFRRDRVAPFRTAAAEKLGVAAPTVRVCDFGHAGDGGLHFNLVAPRGFAEDQVEMVRKIVLDLAIGSFDASFSGEHGLGPINYDAYRRFVPGAERRLAAAVTGAFATGTSPVARALTDLAAG